MSQKRMGGQEQSYFRLKNEKKTVNIVLKEWDYECGDGCCYDYGVELTVNGEACDNYYAGDEVETALKFTLEKLGYKVNIENKYEK